MSKYTDKHVRERYESHSHYVDVVLDSEGVDAISKYKKKFTIAKNTVYKPYYPRSEQRYMLLADFFTDHLVGSVLDVGSRSSELLERLTGVKADLVDKHNKDLPNWDWEKDVVPASDASYDTVVCYDTLEHIDNLHEGFYDVLRLSKDRVLISLPNNWKKALNEMIKGRGRWPSYGIPPERPHDRHKWFFNTEDAEDFFYYHSSSTRGNYEVLDIKYHVPKTILRIKLMYPVLRFVLSEHHFKNLFVETMFVVLQKR